MISAVVMEGIVEKLKSECCQDSTRKTYWCVWRIFNKFFIRLDFKPRFWEDRIVLFVAFLINNRQLKSTTSRSYLSAIRAVLWENNIKLNEDLVLLSSLMRACKIKNDTICTRLPIQKQLLHLIVDECQRYFGKVKPKPYLGSMYKALFLSAYYGMLRVGEITQGLHGLLARNVHIGTNKKNILFILFTSKTHTQGMKPQRIKIKSSPPQGKTSERQREARNIHCPFLALQNYIESRPRLLDDNEQLFIFKDHAPVQQHHA